MTAQIKFQFYGRRAMVRLCFLRAGKTFKLKFGYDKILTNLFACLLAYQFRPFSYYEKGLNMNMQSFDV